MCLPETNGATWGRCHARVTGTTTRLTPPGTVALLLSKPATPRMAALRRSWLPPAGRDLAPHYPHWGMWTHTYGPLLTLRLTKRPVRLTMPGFFFWGAPPGLVLSGDPVAWDWVTSLRRKVTDNLSLGFRTGDARAQVQCNLHMMCSSIVHGRSKYLEAPERL